MTHIEQMIQDMCPNGVEFKTLGDLGVFENTGVDKKSRDDEQEVTLLNFMDVCRHKYIDASVPTMVVTAPDRKIEQCNVLKDDIFITPSSETIDEIGFSAVIMEDLPNVVYSYHIMRYRLNQPNTTTAKFIRYLFEAPVIRKQILKGAKGLTRFGLSKYQFADLSIPFPPLEIQERIVELLDEFSALAAELQAELQMRRKQYEYYRTQLLTPHSESNSADKTDDCNWEWKTLGEICDIKGRIGFRGYTRADQVEKGEGAISLSPANIKNSTITYDDCTYITWEKYEESPEIMVEEGDVIFCKTASVGKTAFIQNLPEKATINPQLVLLKNIKCNNKYLSYYLQTDAVQNAVKQYQGVGSVPNVSQAKLSEVKIALPSLDEQARIVAILDKFEALTTSLSDGIPAEQAAQQKRYEYYRDLLLTFDRC